MYVFDPCDIPYTPPPPPADVTMRDHGKRKPLQVSFFFQKENGLSSDDDSSCSSNVVKLLCDKKCNGKWNAIGRKEDTRFFFLLGVCREAE